MPETEIFSLHSDWEAAAAAAALLFERISAELRPLLPASAEIRHIGATAITGCLTKGDLDIVVRVDARDFTNADRLLEHAFERNTGSIRTDSFAAFEDRETSPHLGIQLTSIAGPNDDFHLFVDIVRADPALVARYNELKRRHDGRPMDEYREAKARFVTEVLHSLPHRAS